MKTGIKLKEMSYGELAAAQLNILTTIVYISGKIDPFLRMLVRKLIISASWYFCKVRASLQYKYIMDRSTGPSFPVFPHKIIDFILLAIAAVLSTLLFPSK